MDNLGSLYVTGEGVTADYVEAHVWLSVARALGNNMDVKALEILETIMSRKQIAKAEKLAVERFEKFKKKK